MITIGHRTISQTVVFFVTFIGFALYHIVRKTPSYVQSSLITEWTPPADPRIAGNGTWTRQSLFKDKQSAEEFMGIINAIFLFVYAPGIIVSGMAADRLDLRLFLTVGMTLSAVVMFIFGPVVEWTGSYSKAGYVVLEILNALFQSTGWPCVLPVMTNWFDKKSRTYVLGIWASSTSVGSILGGLLVSSVVEYGYDYAFLLTTSMLLAGAVVVFFGLVTSPQEIGYSVPDGNGDHHKNDETGNDDDDYDDDYDINSRTDKTMLIEASLHKAGTSHASYGSTVHTYTAKHTDKACSSKERFSDSTLKERKSTMDCPEDTTQFSNLSTHKSCIPARHTQTTLCDSSAAENVALRTKDTSIETGHRTVNENEGKEQCSATKHQCHSEFTIKSKDHDDPKTSIMCSQENGNSVNHANGPIQEKDSPVPSSDQHCDNSLGLSEPQETPLQLDTKEGDCTKQKAIRLWDALLLPGVIPYSLCYVCLKLIIYVFFFWLPFYLTSVHGWTEAVADRLSVWYDVGGIVGATLFIFVMSKLNKCALVMVSMLMASVPLLYGYGILGWGQEITTNAVILFCLGGLLAGVKNPLSAAVSADLIHQEAVQANTRFVATVSGIIEGSGTVGAALGQIIVPYLFPVFGWDSVFYFLIVMTCLTAVCVVPLFLSEVKDVVRNWRK